MTVADFTPQTDVRIDVINIDQVAGEATPNAAANEVTLLVCPDNVNLQLELLSVTYRANVLPVDAGANLNVDIEFVDDSASDAITDLRGSGASGKDAEYATTYAMDDDSTVLVGNEVWRGSQILDPGDSINAEFDVTTPTTNSQGACLVVEYRVLRRSGA